MTRLCGLVLNGGKSTRMGTDKSALVLGDRPVLAHVIDTMERLTSIVVISQNRGDYPGYPTVMDHLNDAGPLSGLHAAMEEREEDWFIVAATDMPFVQPEVYTHLLRQRKDKAVIPSFDGLLQPMSGIYPRTMLDTLDRYLHQGGRSVRGLLETTGYTKVSDFSSLKPEILNRHFFNMNTWNEFEQAKELSKFTGR